MAGLEVPFWLLVLWGPLHIFLGVFAYEAGRTYDQRRGRRGD